MCDFRIVVFGIFVQVCQGYCPSPTACCLSKIKARKLIQTSTLMVFNLFNRLFHLKYNTYILNSIHHLSVRLSRQVISNQNYVIIWYEAEQTCSLSDMEALLPHQTHRLKGNSIWGMSSDSPMKSWGQEKGLKSGKLRGQESEYKHPVRLLLSVDSVHGAIYWFLASEVCQQDDQLDGGSWMSFLKVLY